MKTSELDRVKATQRAIKKAMIDKDILRNEDVAAAIGMPLSTFNLHMRNGRWTVPQMAFLFRVLDMNEEDAALVLGVKRSTQVETRRYR